MAEADGGMGCDFRDVLPTFEQVGRSPLGATAMRVDAPDEGNMHLLELQGTELQTEQYLEPLVEGRLRSGFSMTEPMQGAGSDPKMLRTTAETDGDEWVVRGHTWWTTQGLEADVLLVLARPTWTSTPTRAVRCSSSVRRGRRRVVRNIPHLGSELTGTGRAEIKCHDVRVPEEHLLGEEGQGFSHVQERLGLARLTHCTRFSGMARRALDVAAAYTAEREAFGSTLADKGVPRFELADAKTRLDAARALVRSTADRIDAGEEARIEVAERKVFTANVVQDVVDTALQLCGGNGVGKDLPLADFYERVRAFRIVDAADEVHRRSIARSVFDETDPAKLDPLVRYDV